jgi:hypothetical protein
MSQESIQVPQQKVQEIFKGKAQVAIGDLLLENSQLSAAMETMSVELQDLRQQVAAYRQRDLEQRTPARVDNVGNNTPPDPGPPQDPSTA